MIIWFLLQSILTIGIFISYVTMSDYSGGEVGMTPLTVMLASLIQFLFSIVFFHFLKKYLRDNRRIIFFIFSMLLYELSFLFFSPNFPLMNMSEAGLIGFLNKGYSMSSILSGLLIMVAFYSFQVLKSKSIAD
ncbi:hypothetical protein [Pedobacter frigoris]|uniref:hypothetical protein n=1 Tax=Pedobacter frigoris TaxID=2571272 RepID=UPI00292D5DD3|nr:hypothetical protein [Pedobacter frigoris]